ncbi:uncharacterized protein BXZ73DRAFT_99199 [Epithele typhae]|uniref:uncharacterized protein n=1 Tax=Epithele typhae TaxID=378194 RepID=UPI00200759BF|nr:uncharacterized protein BXZ73DRAFT_99199 [Epithele typhae]KAH9940203.1 hypothetical protein BXZ73DRAFT_99199 [Epithele typhae]
MPVIQLPPELYDHIIDTVQEAVSCEALCACALVCRAWRLRAQHHLFSSITLRDVCRPRSRRRDALIKAISDFPHFSLKIFTLSLVRWGLAEDSGRWEAPDLGWIASLTQLRTLTLCSPHARCTTVSMGVLLPILLALSSLQSLFFDGVFIGNRTRATASFVSPLVEDRRGTGSLQHVKCKVYIPISLRRYIYLAPIDILFNQLVECGVITPTKFKTLDLPQHLPWGTPRASQAFIASIQEWKIERFSAIFVERRSLERPTARHAHDMLSAIASLSSLRSLHIHFVDKMCFEEFVFDPAHFPQLPSAFVDSLCAHFMRPDPPHPALEELSFAFVYPAARLAEHWTPAFARLARALCDRALYPRFRRVRARFLVRDESCAYPWPREVEPSVEEAERNGALLFSAFREGGAGVEIEVEPFWVEGAESSDDGLGFGPLLD